MRPLGSVSSPTNPPGVGGGGGVSEGCSRGLLDPVGRMESELPFPRSSWGPRGECRVLTLAPLPPLPIPLPATCRPRPGPGRQQQQLAQLSCPLLEPLCQLWSRSRKPCPVSRMTQAHLPTSTPVPASVTQAAALQGKSQAPLVHPSPTPGACKACRDSESLGYQLGPLADF